MLCRIRGYQVIPVALAKAKPRFLPRLPACRSQLQEHWGERPWRSRALGLYRLSSMITMHQLAGDSAYLYLFFFACLVMYYGYIWWSMSMMYIVESLGIGMRSCDELRRWTWNASAPLVSSCTSITCHSKNNVIHRYTTLPFKSMGWVRGRSNREDIDRACSLHAGCVSSGVLPTLWAHFQWWDGFWGANVSLCI